MDKNIIIIEQIKGSYKSFEIEDDPIWKDYPLSGVTYPVDYGYVKGYRSEDNQDLDIFVGSGKLLGYIKIWRCDVPIETKILYRVSQKELERIMIIFKPVILEICLFDDEKKFISFLKNYKQ
ncbi:MAG: hypothetical protein Q7R87_00715 [Nanoarchaeota archaeon]|nr:hypothetical protein [Nanoarchaeota archaeon]